MFWPKLNSPLRGNIRNNHMCWRYCKVIVIIIQTHNQVAYIVRCRNQLPGICEHPYRKEQYPGNLTDHQQQPQVMKTKLFECLWRGHMMCSYITNIDCSTWNSGRPSEIFRPKLMFIQAVWLDIMFNHNVLTIHKKKIKNEKIHKTNSW